jgi:Asp-tRNA(Asn)/Glu-tRNA(Gln) amidotransferase B subunit
MIISCIVDKIFEENPRVVEDARTMDSAFNYLVELVIKETEGKGDIYLITSAVRERIHGTL